MDLFSKWLDGRIDEPKAGWKCKALRTTFGNRAQFHIEGDKGTKAKVVKFRLRPDPLAN